MSKTIRLIYPDWMGGANKNYAFGCKLLSMLMPQSDKTEILEVPVDKDYAQELVEEDGVLAKTILLRQQETAAKMLEAKAPEKIIVIGGPCSAEQAPFDYLHGLYPDAGLIWVDAHPDITRPGDSSHEHAMVLGNLMGDGSPDFAALVRHPFRSENVMYAGINLEGLETWEKKYMAEYHIRCVTPEQLRAKGSKPVLEWIKEKGFRHVMIHFDLDALTPDDFRSLLCNEPYLGPVSYAIGAMKLAEITQLIVDVEKETELVGLGICEYMPWDAIHLRQSMERIQLFQE